MSRRGSRLLVCGGAALAVAFAGSGAAVGQDGASRASTSDEIEQARGLAASMDTSRERIYRALAEAREQHDKVKSLCLDDKLNQLDMTIRDGGEHTAALERAAKNGDRDAQNHELGRLGVIRERARAIDEEARRCVAKHELETPGEVLPVEEPPLPGEEATVSYPVAPIITEPPACASCFR